jgi:hypothetical protein
VLDYVLILRDAPVRALVPRDGEAWPRYPALEYLLARARPEPLAAAGWREWLLQQQGISLGDGVGLAGVAAAARGLAPGEYWLATPVHLVAGLDTVRLHPQGLLDLDDRQADQLATDFLRVFAGSGWQLHATGARELLLAAPRVLAAASDDPVHWLGEDPRAGLPRGPDARALRTFATELEMWLHTHAVNEQRDDAGLLTVSGLWLWGGGRGQLPATAAAGLLWGDDLVAQAPWRAQGIPGAPLPAGWRELQPGPARMTGPCYLMLELATLESRWLAPLLEDWRAGSVRRVELVAGRARHVLPRSARWHFWARTRPWWERIA